MSRNRFQNDSSSFFPALPLGWREERIHDVAELRTSNVDKKSEEGEKPVRLCNYVDVYKNDKVTMDLDFMEATATDGQIERFALRVGDVVITKDSETPADIGVPALISESAPDLVCGYHLTILRPNENEVAGSYLFYAVASRLSAYQFYLAANGVTRFGLTYQGTKNLRIALPSVPEQGQIAAFLDWKTGQIDALIGKKKELLEKLKEKRLAVISQAVNRGLDPAAPLRDSGIPWLGMVPEHWEVKRLRYCAGLVTSGSRGWAQHYSDSGDLFLRITNLDRESIDLLLDDIQRVEPPDGAEGARTLTKTGDVLISITADLGSVAVIPQDLEPAYVSQHLSLVRLDTTAVDPIWIAYSIFSHAGRFQLRMAGYGGTKVQLSLGDIKEITFCHPSDIKEQKEVLSFVRTQTKRTEDLIELASQAITRLTEYRTALITAATTGKIDVRGMESPCNPNPEKN